MDLTQLQVRHVMAGVKAFIKRHPVIRTSLMVLFASWVLMVPSLPAKAISTDYQRYFGNGIYYLDPETLEDICATILAGNDNPEKVWNFLVADMGLSAKQAAGIMGNLQAESGFDPNSENEIGAYGIAQWLGGRRIRLDNFASKRGKEPNDLAIQLEFLQSELESSYKSSVLDPIKESDNLEKITRIFLESFEIPCNAGSECDPFLATRLPFAEHWLSKFGSSTATAGGSTCSAGLPSGNAIELAKTILKSPNVGLDDAPQSQIKGVADGKGPCPDVSGDYTIDVELLRVLAGLAQNNKFTIASLHRGCTGSTVGAGTASRHWRGKAADISGSRAINGVTMPSFAAHNNTIQEFVNEARSLLPDNCELGVPNDTYINLAKKSGKSPCINIFLDTPTTTGATGPHVHVGVP